MHRNAVTARTRYLAAATALLFALSTMTTPQAKLPGGRHKYNATADTYAAAR